MKPGSIRISKAWLWGVGVAVIVIGALTYHVVTDLQSPARRSDDLIHAEILSDTPVGMKFADVEAYINRRFGNERLSPLTFRELAERTHAVYGTFTNWSSFKTITVAVFWRFTDNGALSEVEVRRFSQ
jgi:hypothetical protein